MTFFYLTWRNAEHPYQGVDNEPIAPTPTNAAPSGAVFEHERLGGLLRSYSRVA